MSAAPVSNSPAVAAERAIMRPWYAFCRFWCQVTFLFFFRGRVFGRRHVPRTGGVLLVCNHQSYLDPVLAGLSLPREA